MMITAINNVSFKGIKKYNKTNLDKTPPQVPDIDYDGSIYSGSIKVNFAGCVDKKPKIDFEYGVENNFFKLPIITLEDGSKVQAVPDKSQLECAKHLSEGKSVLFDAPTGMGKTAVAHFIMTKNLAENKKSYYPVPIKALANDKYDEFCKKYGQQNVGILTGDRKINPNASIVIMTTEILDYLTYSMDDIEASKVGTIIYDEAHYLGDEERGSAWENSMLKASKKGMQLLLLSATIGNADKITSWLSEIKGSREIKRVSIPSINRPVPLVWDLYQGRGKDARLTRILLKDVDLSRKIELRMPEIQQVIFESEQDYYSRQGKELTQDEYDKIPQKLVTIFGENLGNIDFSIAENQNKLMNEFHSLTSAEIAQIQAIADESSLRILSDNQKRALEVLYRLETNCNSTYEMNIQDYEFIYNELKNRIGAGNKNFKYDSETFKNKLAKAFKNLDEVGLEQISHLIAKPESLFVNEIHQRWQTPNYYELVTNLQRQNLLPAIIFQLSRGGSEQIAKILDKGTFVDKNNEESDIDIQEQEKQISNELLKVDLTSNEEKRLIGEIIDKYKKSGMYLGFGLNQGMLLKGVAVHNGDRLPQYKKLIEELFSKKLIKVVVATSTLGAGINMPAKTVVMSNTAYKEYNPKTEEVEYVPLTANDFHQMAGRAGRRGIDKVGRVVLYNLNTPPTKFRKDGTHDYAGRLDELWHAYQLMKSPADDIRSAFGPSAIMLGEYFAKNNTTAGFSEIIRESLRYYLAKNKQKFEAQMLEKFNNYTNILIKQGCLEKNRHNEYNLTPKGELLLQCQGLDPLLLNELLFEEKLANFTPVQLAQVAASLQGMDEQKNDGLKDLVLSKIKQLEKTTEGINSIDYLYASASFESAHKQVLRSLLQGRVHSSEIKYMDSFSGLVGYLFASLNQNNSDSISNFEKIIKTQDLVLSLNHDIDKAYARKDTEGNVYKIIAGAISTLKQISRISSWASECQDLYPNTQYWKNLYENTQEAIRLLDREPINNDPNYANNITNI